MVSPKKIYHRRQSKNLLGLKVPFRGFCGILQQFVLFSQIDVYHTRKICLTCDGEEWVIQIMAQYLFNTMILKS
jgi:hypothetical protein